MTTTEANTRVVPRMFILKCLPDPQGNCSTRFGRQKVVQEYAEREFVSSGCEQIVSATDWWDVAWAE